MSLARTHWLCLAVRLMSAPKLSCIYTHWHSSLWMLCPEQPREQKQQHLGHEGEKKARNFKSDKNCFRVRCPGFRADLHSTTELSHLHSRVSELVTSKQCKKGLCRDDVGSLRQCGYDVMHRLTECQHNSLAQGLCRTLHHIAGNVLFSR